MRRHRQSLRLFIGFVLLIAAAARIDAQPRPFTVVLDGNANPVFIDPCTIQNTETGTGHATHMGTIVWQSIETVDLCASPEGAQVSGEFTLTAADGDQVTGTYQTVAQLDFGSNQVLAAGAYTISGGTGRFAGATGEGDLTAEGNLLPPFEVVGRFSGTITY